MKRRSKIIVKAITRVFILALSGDKDAGPGTREMEASFFATTQFNHHLTHALITKQLTENHSVPYVDLPPRRECMHQ